MLGLIILFLGKQYPVVLRLNQFCPLLNVIKLSPQRAGRYI